MERDPIVEEIRAYRKKHEAKFKHDLDAICEDIKKLEAELRPRMVNLESRRKGRRTGT